MLSDRQSIQTQGKHQVELSAQALLNCGVGSCSKGGTPHDALNFIQKFGLPEAACQGYLGTSPSRESCSGINNCATCSGTPFHYNCTEVKGYKRWRILDYNTIIGISNMKSEVATYGPIVCGVHASEEFLKYRGGIFSEISIKPEINHYVEVIGWGEENGKSYWLGRNSWGTAWGESSFFRMQMGSNNLGIETKCYFGNTLI
jgi:cathepsin X